MDAETYLKQYSEKKREIKRIENRKNEAEAAASGGGINYDGMPRGTTTSKPTERFAITLADLNLKYKQAIDIALKTMDEVADTIELLPDTLQKDILHARYIELKNDGNLRGWKSITRRLSRRNPEETYSTSHIKHVHTKAVKSIQEILNERTQ